MSQPRCFRVLIAVALALLSLTARAEDHPASHPDVKALIAETGTAWEVAKPQPPEPGRHSGTPEGGYTTGDEVVFKDQKDLGILDQFCRNVELKLQKDIDLGGFGVGSFDSYTRRMRQLPDGRQGLLETVHVDLHAGKTLSITEGGLSFNLGLSASTVGESIVLRPLKGKHTCSQVLELFKDFKTAFPFTPERIADMKVGELWKIPLRLTWGVAPSIGKSAPVGNASASLSITVGGYSEDGQTSVTLYRLSDSKLRFRFRIEKAEVRTPWAGSLVLSLPAKQLAAQATHFKQWIADGVAKALLRYADAYVTYSHTVGEGDKIVLELILDPNDRDQMEGLSEIVHGDMGRLFKLLAERGGFLSKPLSQRSPAELSAQYVAKTGAKESSTFTDKFTNEAKTWSFKIPFFFQGSFSDTKNEDRIQRLDTGDAQVRLFQTGKTDNKNYFDTIVVGPLVRDNQSRVTQAFTGDDPATGGTMPPALIYMQQEGFWRTTTRGVYGSAWDMARLTSMVGYEREGGPNPRARLPAPEVLPPFPEYHAGGGAVSEPTYRTGTSMLALYIEPQGVARILTAEPERIRRAFQNTLDGIDRRALAAMSAAGVDEKELWRQARAASEAVMGTVLPDYFMALARRQENLVADIAEVRDAPGHDTQAQALTRLVRGKETKARLENEQFLRVVLQLIDLKDVRADYSVDVNTGDKKIGNVNARLKLNDGIDADPFVKYVGELRRRFAAPTDFTD